MSDRPRSIVIVGRDGALWLAAAALGHALGPMGIEVIAVELPTKLGPGSIYATHPALESLHSRIGIEEARLLHSTSGSFSLGWNIAPISSSPFLLAHGSYGAPIDGRDFFAYWQKARHFGLDVAFENFSPTAMAARHGRILVPDEGTELFGRTDYAYHLPSIAYCAVLKSLAHRLGVTIHQTLKIAVQRDDAGDEIRGVILDDGRVVTGDLFIDASGTDAALIGDAVGVSTESWREFFPFDRLLSASSPRLSAVPAYAELRLSQGSWKALHGSQETTYVVNAFAGEGEAADVAVRRAAEDARTPLSDVSISDVAPARRNEAWSGNCIAIGGAACALDPLFDLELFLVQLGIVHSLSLFPVSLETGVERAEFNRVMRSHFERIRDFQAALYNLSGLVGPTPSSLAQKIDAFRARGTIAPMEDETFSADQWRALFVGLGLMPESWPPSIDTTPPDQMKEGFRRILGFVHDKVLEQPKHDFYLAELGASVR